MLLAHLAAVTGRTKKFYAREAILIHLEDLEDYYLCADISARIARGENLHTAPKK